MRRGRFRSTGLLAALALGLVGVARAGELEPGTAERLRPVLPAAIEFYNQRNPDPLPGLDTGQVEELLEGRVVRIRRRAARDGEDPPERVTGYRIVARPRAQVWVAALDPDFQATGLLTERRLERREDGSALWHQYLSLPWPVADRQWVIEVRVRTDLARRTDDLVWEQSWDLAPSGPEIARASIASGRFGPITPETAEGAVYVPANEGSWILFRLEDDLTLVAYRVIARVGGHIPDSWIASFGMAQLAGVLDAVAAHAAEAPDFYDPERSPIVGGDGEVVGRFGTADPR